MNGGARSTGRSEAPVSLGTAQVRYAGRLDASAGWRVFAVSLLFSAPSIVAAIAVIVDAASREAAPLYWLAAALFVAFALFALWCSWSAWRLIGARYWVVEEGLFLDRPEQLLALPAGGVATLISKKAAGPALRIDGLPSAPAFLFLPGLALKMGGALTLYSVQFGKDFGPVARALPTQLFDPMDAMGLARRK